MEKRDFAGLELGPPDISIRNVEAQTYIVVVLFFGGRGVGGWVLRVRLTHATTPTGLCFGALRHRRIVHPDTTLVCLVRLHLRMQTNLLSFANESVCITMPVFSLQ